MHKMHKLTQSAKSAVRAIAILLLAVNARAQSLTAFTEINVFGMQAPQTVLVRDQLIVSVSPGRKIPTGAKVIDGKGLYMTPGLAEMHGHTPVPGGDPDSQFVKDMMFLYVANGVTLVRGMLGAPGQLELRSRIEMGKTLGPTLYLAGPSFNGNSISSPRDAIDRVQAQVAEGWDLLKVHPGLTRAEYDAMALTAHSLGIRFGGHVPGAVGLEHAIAMGQHTFDHIDGYLQYLGFPETPIDHEALADIAAKSRMSRVWIVPTLVLWDHVIGLGDPDQKISWFENAYWPRRQVQSWYRSLKNNAERGSQSQLQAYSDARDRVLMALHEAGVGIMLGTDSPQIFSVPGFSIHREMRAMVDAGMTADEILHAGTTNVSDYLQGSHAVGRIAPGYQADLIVTGDDPTASLAALQNPIGVMVRGHWLDANTIRARLDEIRARNKTD